MGVAGSADIFQAEMSNLMASLEYIRAYIDDLLVITKGDLDDHLAKLEAVFIRLQDAGLKVGGPVEKMSFFQIVHMTKVSTQIHSSISQYDVYKFS